MSTIGRPPTDAAFQNFKALDNLTAFRVVSGLSSAGAIVAGELVGDVSSINDLTVENLIVTGTETGLYVPTYVEVPINLATLGDAVSTGNQLTLTGGSAVLTEWNLNVPAGEYKMSAWLDGTDTQSISLKVNGDTITGLTAGASPAVATSAAITHTGGEMLITMEAPAADMIIVGNPVLVLQ